VTEHSNNANGSAGKAEWHGPGFTRRELLGIIGGTLVAGFILGRVTDSDGNASSETTSSETNPVYEFDVDKLDAMVSEGFEQKWDRVVAYPGFVIARPGTRFYSDASLRHEIPAPIQGEQRLGILRPFFANASLNANALTYQGPDIALSDIDAIREAQPIPNDVFAFLPPNTDDPHFIYCRFDSSTMDRYTREFDNGDDVPFELDLTAQQVGIRRKQNGGQKVPYITHRYTQEIPPRKGSGMFKFRHHDYYVAAGWSTTYQGQTEAQVVASTFENDVTSEPFWIPGFTEAKYTSRRP
jgi:hypothetical protein